MVYVPVSPREHILFLSVSLFGVCVGRRYSPLSSWCLCWSEIDYSPLSSSSMLSHRIKMLDQQNGDHSLSLPFFL